MRDRKNRVPRNSGLSIEVLNIQGEFMKVESRCGILCNECEYREKMNCGTCINIEKPFWGDGCPVKNCCEEKELEHCGLCSDFPCDLLNQFAYDKDQGDDGKRIEQCKKWAGV